MFKFDQDDFFNYLVATDQVDDFLGKEEKDNEDKNNINDELVELDNFDDENDPES